MFLPHPRVKVSIVGNLRDREVPCSASDRQGSNFESCAWRTVSSQSSHHPQEVLLARFSLYVHTGGLKPDPFHFYSSLESLKLNQSIENCLLHRKRFWRIKTVPAPKVLIWDTIFGCFNKQPHFCSPLGTSTWRKMWENLGRPHKISRAHSVI